MLLFHSFGALDISGVHSFAGGELALAHVFLLVFEQPVESLDEQVLLVVGPALGHHLVVPVVIVVAVGIEVSVEGIADMVMINGGRLLLEDELLRLEGTACLPLVLRKSIFFAHFLVRQSARSRRLHRF